jgi:hypothetical protein
MPRLPATQPGDVYARLIAIERVNSRGKWLFRCQCGTVKNIDAFKVRSGLTRSCGCLVQNRKPSVNRKPSAKKPSKPKKRPARDGDHLYTVSGVRLRFSSCPTGVMLRAVRRQVDESDLQLTEHMVIPRREVDLILRTLKVFDPDATARMFKRHPMVIRRVAKVMDEKRSAAKVSNRKADTGMKRQRAALSV